MLVPFAPVSFFSLMHEVLHVLENLVLHLRECCNLGVTVRLAFEASVFAHLLRLVDDIFHGAHLDTVRNYVALEHPLRQFIAPICLLLNLLLHICQLRHNFLPAFALVRLDFLGGSCDEVPLTLAKQAEFKLSFVPQIHQYFGPVPDHVLQVSTLGVASDLQLVPKFANSIHPHFALRLVRNEGWIIPQIAQSDSHRLSSALWTRLKLLCGAFDWLRQDWCGAQLCQIVQVAYTVNGLLSLVAHFASRPLQHPIIGLLLLCLGLGIRLCQWGTRALHSFEYTVANWLLVWQFGYFNILLKNCDLILELRPQFLVAFSQALQVLIRLHTVLLVASFRLL